MQSRKPYFPSNVSPCGDIALDDAIAMFSLLFFLIKKVTKKSRQCQCVCRIGFGKFIGIASVGEVAIAATQPCGVTGLFSGHGCI
jgi:hypothetical protein